MNFYSSIFLTALISGCSAKFDTVASEGEAVPGTTISGETIVENATPDATDTGDIFGEEICDGIDNDGDGDIDEGLLVAFYWDEDGDGWGSTNDVGCDVPEGAVLEPGDCADDNPEIHPEADEICNGIDENCNSEIDEGLSQTFYADNDGDGYGTPLEATSACEPPEGFVDNSDDCDDEAAIISPDNLEICNYQDDNCDGVIDEDLQTLVYPDGDDDGFGVLLEPEMHCDVPLGYTTTPGDCDDTEDLVNPDGIEVCNGLDNDCNGLVDDSPTAGTMEYWTDLDGDGHGNGVPLSGCSVPDGYSELSDDCDDMDASRSPSAEEICNDVDDDCDGDIDEDALIAFYTDDDGDGYGTSARVWACSPPEGAATSDGDCDDTDASINPGADELCDGMDSNCNGLIDEDPIDGTRWYADDDEDGFGDPDELEVLCSARPGFVDNDEDCDPTREDINPDADERCNDIDDDCDGSVDEEPVDAPTWYFDEDGDGFGLAEFTEEACSRPADFVANDGDCNDADDTISPIADESCDEIDNDCNGVVDDAAIDAVPAYPDDDEDGFGASSALATLMCEDTLATGWSTNHDDCDDDNALVNPLESELCNGIDDNCNGEIDEESEDRVPVYVDEDLDGYGSGFTTTLVCEVASGWSLVNTDCDDSDGMIYPEADEYCNGIDDDCDGSIDEEAVDTLRIYPDEDRDGYGPTDAGEWSCEIPDDWTLSGGDCDDEDDGLHPGIEETCDGYDENCDGIVDNGATDCDCTQKNYGSNSYMFCNSTKRWNQARNWCDARDYVLVTVNSYEEQVWLINQIRYDASIANEPHWIGLNDKDYERYSSRSGWVWESGESYSYSAWRDFYPWPQPDDWGGEDCVEINRWEDAPADRDWNDLPCSDNIRFICEARP